MVIGSDHADYAQIIAVGGNTGVRLGTCFDKRSLNYGSDEWKFHLLKQLADQLGYRVSKKPSR